ncbi:unnamed protein product [Auanema sp. JU1783]|nr:unnamed protein product [Auanema sp. JU1783]
MKIYFIIPLVLYATLFSSFFLPDGDPHSYEDPPSHLRPIIHTNFCVIADVFKSSSRVLTIPMMLHITPDYIGESLLRTVNSWDGRVVLAVYTDSSIRHPIHLHPSIEQTIRKLQQLFHCNPHLTEQVTVHIFYLATEQLNCEPFSIELSQNITCENPFQLDKINYQKLLGYYPVNAARNIARKFDTSACFVQADVQQVFSSGAEEKLRKAFDKYGKINNGQVAFIIPRFESEKGTMIPRTIEQLEEVHDKTVFQFHAFSYPTAHNVTDIKKWLHTSSTTNSLISEITNYEDHNTPVWEPMFLAHSSLPFHNETIWYGMRNQAALVSLMCCLKYKFIIVNSVFNVHEGVRRIPFSRIVHPYERIRAKKIITAYYISLVTRYNDRATMCLGHLSYGLQGNQKRKTRSYE